MCRKLILISFVLLCLAVNARAQTELQQDIGNPAMAGSATYDAATGAWTVVGGGEDVWGSSDQFYYVFRPLAGDGDVSVHYISMDLTHEWAKVGVMIRETLDGNSKHVLISQTGSHGIQTLWRDATGGSSDSTEISGGGMNWLKIERAGDVINTYYSPVGAILWIPHQSLSVPMSATVTVGMFVNSHVGDTLCTAVFDNVVFNVPPATVAWNLSPADGSLLKPAEVTLSWMPGDTATSHNVHLGTTSPPELVVNQIETSYVPALEGGVTYYWRIDEVEADSRVVEGAEMSFKTYREGTGTVLREVWEGIGGVQVPDLTGNANYPANPSYSEEVTSLEAPSDFADDFGSRLHGWLLPETSGDYTFWIAADDGCELLLSTSDNPADAVSIAGHTSWTGSRDWDSMESQKSEPVSLAGGEKYYISALYKEGGGGDNMSVAWEGPDNPARDVIGGYYLMPFENLWAWEPSPADGATGVDSSPTLSWLPAVDAVSYDVYLGDTLLGSTAETSIEAEALMLEGSYAWQVDAVTETEVRPGPVWTFTVKNNIVLDNFEAYDIVPEKVADQSVVADSETIVAAAPDDARLLALYSFENNANDTSGNARDCGAQAGESGYPTFEEGIDGQAIRFNGDGDHVADPDAGDYMNGLSEFTISLWVKSDVIDTDKGFLMGDDYSWSDRRGMRYDVLGGGCNRCPNVIKYGVATPEGNEEDESSSYVQTTEWQHILMTWKSEVGLKLYVDGVLDEPGDNDSAEGGVTEGYTTLLIGKGSKDNSADESWDGLVDEVRIYSYALSYGEARSLAGKTEDLVIQEAYGPMIAEYTFDADASDSSGNNLNGILIGDANTATGLLQLDGDGDCVDLGHHAVLNPETGQFSISAWFNLSDWGSNWSSIIISKRGENGRGWQLRRRGGTHYYCFTVRGSSGGDDPRGNIEPTLNEWHHIAAIFDPVGGKRTVYMDGQLDKQINDTGRCRGSGHNAYIGARAKRNNDGPETFFNGMIDDVKLFQTALTSSEVLELAEIAAITVISDTWSGSAAADMSSHWGDRSMTVEYAGEVVRSMPVADMTTGGAAALSLWVSGDPDNVTDQMSLTITDADGQTATMPYDSDAIDLTSTDWQEWNIDLRVLGAADISNVDSIALNIAGSGVVSVDDIRLYN